MGVEIEKTSSVNPGSKMSGAATSSAVSTGSQKVSMFAAKTGFVIPKNKLSGSMVPVFRGGKKSGVTDSNNEESTNQVQRKTKWDPDLTLDSSVRRGRALAYQTRVEQITQLLKSGTPEATESQDALLEAEISDDKPSSPQVNKELPKLEDLELEKREAIGEILKLNPNYRAPSDYKPLLKEDRFPIPVKEYPDYNFIGLIYGPGGENQRRLEKETGAKIQICGVKAETREKDEIKPSDGLEIQSAYEELYVRISADTFDKIDEAASLIELLVTSISGNLVSVSSSSVDNASVLSQSQGAAASQMVSTAMLNQGDLQQVQENAQSSIQGRFQYPGGWFPPGPHQPPRFNSPQNPTAPILNNPIHMSPSLSNPYNMPSLFGPRPAQGAGMSSILQNPPLVPPRQQSPAQISKNPYISQQSPGNFGPPRIPSMMAQANVSVPFPFTGNHPPPTGLTGSTMSSFRQSAPNITPGSLPDRPLTPTGFSSGWSGVGLGSTSSLGPSNMRQTPLQMPPPHRPPVITQSGVPSSSNMNSFVTFPSGPVITPVLNTVPSNQTGGPPPPLSASLNPTLIRAPANNPGSAPFPLQSGIGNSASGGLLNNTHTVPTVTSPNSSNFTFQPHRPQNTANQILPGLSAQNSHINPTLQLPAPQPPSFHHSVHSLSPKPVNQVFRGSQSVSHHMGHPQMQTSASSHTGFSASQRLPSFHNGTPLLHGNPPPHMGPRDFDPAPQMTNVRGGFPYPPRPGNMQLQQNYPARGIIQPEISFAPNQQMRGNLPFGSGRPSSSPGGQQIYDPFSPTSVTITPKQ